MREFYAGFSVDCRSLYLHRHPNRHGLFNFAQATLPLLLESVDASPPYPPTLLVTGATASLRGGVKFADFAAGKFAKRAITQSLAREFGPKGVHVAHIIIDGGIDIPRLAEYKGRFNGGAPDGMLSPDAVSVWPLLFSFSLKAPVISEHS